MTTVSKAKLANRIKLVEEHVKAEDNRDVAATMRTLGENPFYILNGQQMSGRQAIQDFYTDLMHGFPDLRLDTKWQHVSDTAVIVEVLVSGTQKNPWLGIPATGRRAEFPVCAVFEFDEKEKIAGERVYFDMALVLKQLGALPAKGS